MPTNLVMITPRELEMWAEELHALSALGVLTVTCNGVLVLDDAEEIRTRDDLFARLVSTLGDGDWCVAARDL